MKKKGGGGKRRGFFFKVLKTKHLQRVGASAFLFEMAGSCQAFPAGAAALKVDLLAKMFANFCN